MDNILKLFEYLKYSLNFFKKIYSKIKNRNKFFIEDYKQQEKNEFYFSKKLDNNRYGVFCNTDKEPLRIYKKPEHNNPKKLSKQFAKKLAWKKARCIK